MPLSFSNQLYSSFVCTNKSITQQPPQHLVLSGTLVYGRLEFDLHYTHDSSASMFNSKGGVCCN